MSKYEDFYVQAASSQLPSRANSKATRCTSLSSNVLVRSSRLSGYYSPASAPLVESFLNTRITYHILYISFHILLY